MTDDDVVAVGFAVLFVIIIWELDVDDGDDGGIDDEDDGDGDGEDETEDVFL